MSVRAREYVVEDDDGRKMFGPFVTAAEPVALAQQIADFKRTSVRLEVRDRPTVECHIFTPAPPRIFSERL